MPEAAMAVVKPEMKSYIWLQTSDGSIQQVEEGIAMFCPIICREMLQSVGSSKTNPIMLPERVDASTLALILDYCRFHQVPGHSIKERKAFDDRFVRLDTKILCELTSAADSLQLKPLVDLSSRTLARIIEGKSPEEIREIFNLPDDLTEEEKLEPLKNVTDDPRIRLLNRLYARKRRELREREEKKAIEAEEEHVDERSVDDLLSYINGEDKGSKGAKASKSKKKNRRRKIHTKISNGDNEEANGHPHSCQDSKPVDGSVLVSSPNSELHMSPFSSKLDFDDGDIDDELGPAMKEELDSKPVDGSVLVSSLNSELHTSPFSSKLDFDDGDIDDELDPAMKEELDREVEDFARRLNSDWPERMQEILSLGQERRLTSISLSANGSTQRYTSVQRR